MAVPNPYQAYQRNKYETASPHRLILMMYDGVLKFAGQAELALDQQDHVNANRALTKMQDILYELIACLNTDQGGQLAANLNNLYLYMIDLLVQANLSKDKSKVLEVMEHMKAIKGAWEQIGKEVTIAQV